MFVFLFAMMFVAIGITIAYAAVGNTTTNVVTVGNVKIELMNEDDEEVNANNNPNPKAVMPGDKISKVVKVKNVGDYAAYIRVKVKKEWENNSTVKPLTAAAIVPLEEEGWVLGTGEDKGYDYYYYQSIVPATKKEITFMNYYELDSALIDNDTLNANYKNVKGKITVEAEAIQADFYQPIYFPEDKGNVIKDWPDIAFGKDFKNDAPIPSIATQSAVTQSAVEFVGDSGNFVSFNDTNPDLFLNIKGMMPGEEREQIIEIENTTSNKTVRVYMYSTVPQGMDLTSIEGELLKSLQIRVDSWNKSRQGDWQPLFDENISGNPNLLGEFEPGEKRQLRIWIRLPGTWKHSYCQTKVNWTFVTEKDLITPTPYYPTNSPTPQVTPTVEPESPTVSPVVTPSLEPTPEKTVEPTDIPINADPPKETPNPTLEPSPTPKPTNPPTPIVPTPTPIAPTPTDFEIGIDDPPMADASSEPRPSKTPKPAPTKKPKKTKKPATPTPEVTKNPEESVGGDVPQIDVTPNLPEESATKTGDDTPIFFWSVVCLVSLFGVLYNGIVLGKKKNN